MIYSGNTVGADRRSGTRHLPFLLFLCAGFPDTSGPPADHPWGPSSWFQLFLDYLSLSEDLDLLCRDLLKGYHKELKPTYGPFEIFLTTDPGWEFLKTHLIIS